jgi:hypothetical protein
MTSVHRIASVSFREGRCECSCGVVVEGGWPEELAVQFTAHRVSAGAKPGKTATLGYDYTGATPWRHQAAVRSKASQRAKVAA